VLAQLEGFSSVLAASGAPWSPLTSPHRVLGRQALSARAVALLEAGQRSGDAFCGRSALSLGLLVGPLRGAGKTHSPCRELSLEPGSASPGSPGRMLRRGRSVRQNEWFSPNLL